MKYPKFGSGLPGVVGLLFFLILAPHALGQEPDQKNLLWLASGWQIQSASQAAAAGGDISTAGYEPAGWHPASVPSTVLSALVKDGTYSNLYSGTNLASLPVAPFTNAWWFRKEFDVSNRQAG